MFYAIRVRFLKYKDGKTYVMWGRKHIFGANTCREAIKKFMQFAERVDIQPVDLKVFMINDVMEASGHYEKESKDEVWL